MSFYYGPGSVLTFTSIILSNCYDISIMTYYPHFAIEKMEAGRWNAFSKAT